MGNPIMGGCPYQAEDGYNDRNRFPHGHLFIGEIENGKRYPFGVYTKEESDAKYAAKQTEADLAALTDVVSGKADESECIDIRARLDALEYQGIKISSISASPTLCELGSSNDINISWSLNKTAEQQNINGTPVTGNSKQYTGVTSDATYTLNVSDGQTSATKSVVVSFANQIYYGASASTSSAASLNKILSNVKTRTVTVDAGADEYIIYAIPVRLGTVSFFVSGFEGGFENPELKILTNASGYQEQYYVYRSTNKNLGETTVEVREG